jgi:hypothetical protein
VRTFFHEGEFFIILYGSKEGTGVSFMFFVWLRRLLKPSSLEIENSLS